VEAGCFLKKVGEVKLGDFFHLTNQQNTAIYIAPERIKMLP